MTGWREQVKDTNRRKIIDAARALVLETGATDFTMKDLAARASVSTFTTHNLIGTKARVLFQVLVEHVAAIGKYPLPPAGSPADLAEYALHFVDAPIDLYVSNERLYRTIIRFYLASNDRALRAIYLHLARRYWVDAVDQMAGAGLLPAATERLDLARAMHAGFTGTMEFWAHGELTANGLRAQARTLLALILLGTIDEACQPHLRTVIAIERSAIEDTAFIGAPS